MTIAFNLFQNPDTGRFSLDKPRGARFKGQHTYTWIVTKEDGERRQLGGTSGSLSSRLSAYIRGINNPSDDNELSLLARNPQNKVIVQITSESNKGAKAVEEAVIARIPPKERMNKTKGGNGGGSWSQYGDRLPTVTSFPKDTPEKYYPFVERTLRGREIISLKTTPSVTRVKGAIYKIREVTDDEKTQESYIGMTSQVVVKRGRSHASKATHHPDSSKVAKAISENPTNFVWGILPTTSNFSPLSLRAAEKAHIEMKKPSLNSNKGGGGSAPMPREESSSSSIVKRRKIDRTINFSKE